MYDTILVPTDGSETAAHAAREAFALADELGAAVHVVYVVDESASTFLLSTEPMAEVLTMLTEEGKYAVSEAERLAAGVPTETTIVRGMNITDALLAYIDDHSVDLVVMGTRGRRGMDHFLGSTTERLLAQTSVPVLVVSED